MRRYCHGFESRRFRLRGAGVKFFGWIDDGAAKACHNPGLARLRN